MGAKQTMAEIFERKGDRERGGRKAGREMKRDGERWREMERERERWEKREMYMRGGGARGKHKNFNVGTSTRAQLSR